MEVQYKPRQVKFLNVVLGVLSRRPAYLRVNMSASALPRVYLSAFESTLRMTTMKKDKAQLLWEGTGPLNANGGSHGS